MCLRSIRIEYKVQPAERLVLRSRHDDDWV